MQTVLLCSAGQEKFRDWSLRCTMPSAVQVTTKSKEGLEIKQYRIVTKRCWSTCFQQSMVHSWPLKPSRGGCFTIQFPGNKSHSRNKIVSTKKDCVVTTLWYIHILTIECQETQVTKSKQAYNIYSVRSRG